jgi:hypothetical protein
MNLILAQGAEHTDPANLKKIIARINEQNVHIMNYGTIFSDTLERCLLYAPDFVNVFGGDDDLFPINCADYSVETKYDGFSYLNTEGKFFSKRLSTAKGSEGNPVEKTGHMPHIKDLLRYVYEQCGADLHGEIYIPGGISDDVSKILGCTEDKAIYRISKMNWSDRPCYMLIDIRAIYGKSLINEPHRVRRALLSYVYHKYINHMRCHGSEYINLTEDLNGDPCEHFTRIVKAGGEGIIIKRETALYIPDKKPANNWIKGKKKITHDVVLMGINNNGTGKNANLFGSFNFGHIINGKLVKCGDSSSGLNDETRNYIYRNADTLIANHQVIEIEAIQESVKSFRNAVFLRLRDDKDWTECKPINIRVKENLI